MHRLFLMNSLLAIVLIVIVSLPVTTAGGENPAVQKKVDVSSHAGRYSFNPTCTDENAVVTVAFRKPKHGEYSESGWVADGTLDNFHGVEIKFKGAPVRVDEDGSVEVNAQFFGFKLSGGDLEWLPNYKRALSKAATAPAQKEKSESERGAKKKPSK